MMILLAAASREARGVGVQRADLMTVSDQAAMATPTRTRRYARLWAQGRCRVDRADLGILRACEPVCAPQIAGAFVTLAMRP